MQLKPIIEKLEALGSSNILIKFWNFGRLIALLMILIVFISWIPELTPGFVNDFFNKGQGGIVIVDSPEVYSRERLINDRFRQASWLEKELDESPDMLFGNQAITDLHQILGQETKIGVSDSAPQDGSPPIIAGERGTDPAKKNNSATTVSPSERFRDIRAYREEIRTEMMETLLDDRHDIKGNTLYRLKFDTTVLPEDKTEKLVVIQVKLARAQLCESINSKPLTPSVDSGSRPDDRHIPCISIKAIHSSWLKQTEEKINLAIDGTIKSFRRGSLSTPDFAELVRFLQVKVSRLNESKKWKSKNSFASKQIRNINIWNQIKKFHPDCVAMISSEEKPKVVKDFTADRKKRELKTRSCPLVPVARFFPENADPETLARYGKLRKLLLYYYYVELAPTSAFQEFIEIHKEFLGEKFKIFRKGLDKRIPRQGISIELRVAEIRTDAEKRIADAKKRIADTEKQGAVDEKLIADNKKVITGAQEVIADAENVMDDAESLIAQAELIERNLLRYAVVAMWIDKYTYNDKDREEECETLYDDQLEVFDPKSLSCIAHLKKTACNDVDFCTVKVEARIPKAQQEVICSKDEDGDDQEGDNKVWCQVQETFKRLLNIGEAYYSYAVTPKESAQRVLTIASERRQKQLALSLLASSANGLDPATVTSITRAISESATQIEQIQRKPLILSFGRGQPVETSNNPEVPQGIDFGWIIGPKFVFADRADGEIKFYHAPAQNSLSAVISVPSWWTTIGLEIDTCWIDQAELPDLEKIKVRGLKKIISHGLWGETELRARNYVLDLCNTGSADGEHDVDIDYLVRLPGSTEELPRKFGYEIERVPAISEDRPILAEFYVGQKNASLMIQGQELWRSTVVTMGHQKADNIEVLPNMKGIIATFETIDSPSQKIEYVSGGQRGRRPANCYVRSEVVVWTSEGRTVENKLFAKIHANPLLARKSKADEGVVFPDGFGGCYYPPEPKSDEEPTIPEPEKTDSTNPSSGEIQTEG
jgi:hypothetical protein